MKDKTKKNDRHKRRLLSARAGPRLWGILEQLAREQRRSIAQTVLLLVESALEQKGIDVPNEN